MESVNDQLFGKSRTPSKETIMTANYLAKVHFIDDEILYSEKSHLYQKGSHFETYASDWVLAYADLPENRVSIRSGFDLTPLSGPTVIYQPPFSLVEIHVEAGPLIWNCICSSVGPLVEIDRTRILSEFKFEVPRCRNDVINILNRINRAPNLLKPRQVSAVSEKTKSFIDRNFCEDLKITNMAKELNYSRVVMTRTFKKDYGLSPIEYRHKLRIHEALIRMRKGRSITDALYDVGFSDPSQFIYQFKNLLNALPKQYNLAKIIKRT